MKIVSPVIHKGKEVELPYKIVTENPKLTIGIFGDSFAQLAEHALDNNFIHEISWIYYLSNLVNANCDAWGVSDISVGDIIYLYNNRDIEYDLYIFFNTNPLRPNIISNNKLTKKLCEDFNKDISNKKSLMIYWHKLHYIFDFKTTKIMYSNFHKTNVNQTESRSIKVDPNPLDKLGSYHHMSNRGNLLLAIEINKHIANLL